ncbi:MAG TPA: hypothetical protein VD913_06390, partial [bacterium]|nr:hypothetical protein [bacterium]
QYLDYIRSGYFDELDFAEERFHAFSSRRSREGMIFDDKKYQDLKAELERLTKKAGKTRYNSFLENWGRKIEKLFYSVSIFEELDGTMLARTLFLLSQIMISASREQPVSQLGFTAPSRLARDTVGPLTKSVKSIPDRLLRTLDKHDFKKLAGILKKHDIELVPGWAEHRIAINNAKYLSQGAKRAEVRTFDTTDAALFRLQQEYESIRDLTILGGAFGEEKGGGAYFGLHKQKYLLKRAVGDPKWRTNGDPRFYFDAVSIYLGVEDAEETVKLLESLKGKSIPDYAFIFRTDEPVEQVRERLEKAQSARPGQHLVPFGVVIGNVAGTLSGSLWARRTFQEYLEMLGYQWDSLKVKALLLAWGSGGRVFPMGQHNKILAPSPISRESYLEENLRGILQYFQPKMKYSRQPGQNFVIYPDANKLIDREMNIGKHDFQFLGSLVNHDQQELNELGIANISKEGILINFVEKPKDTTEIEMRLGPGVKFRSFGDVYGTDEFFDDLERRYGPYIKDPKLVVDFAMHLGEAVTVGNAPAVFGTHGLEESEWYEKKIDKLKDKNIKQAFLTQARELASSFRIGTASGGFESRFIHSNNMEANYDMMLHLNGDPFIREFAKVKADSKGYIIGPNVILGKDVVVEPGAVILGDTIIQHGRIGAFAVVRDVWADKLIAEPRSLANMVDARDEALHIDSGFYANDVFIQHKSKIEKVRYVRRINEDINAPVHFSAIVLTIESLRNARGDVDSEVMQALVDILKATPPNRQPAEEGFENKFPVIAFVSDDSLDEIKNIIFSFIPEEYLHRILIYSENGARATGFRPFTWMEIDYFRHSFPKLNKVMAKNRRALNKLGMPYYELRRNYPSFLSYNLFERPKDLFSAAHALQSAHPVYNIFISEKENLLDISLRDRKGVALDLMNRFGISKRPHQRIMIIGSDAGRLTHNGGRSLMRKDTRLTEIVKDPEFEGRVYSLVVGSDAAELSSAVERPRGVSGSQATLEALKEVKRTIEQPVAHRAWKIIENRYSMQDIKQAYSRQAVERFDDERKREIQRIQRLQQSRSEFRHSILTEDHTAETGSLKVLNQAMGKAMEDTKISADRIVQWFSKAQRRANPSHAVSNAPSYFIADWDSRRLDLKDIEIAGNALSPKSSLILHVSDRESDSLRELINQNIVLKGGRRIVLSSLSPERIIDQLTQSPRYSLKSRDVYRVAVEPALLKEENLFRGVWHGARGFLQPGRILVLTSGRFEFPGAQSIHVDRHSLEGFVRALEIDEKVRVEIRRAA